MTSDKLLVSFHKSLFEGFVNTFVCFSFEFFIKGIRKADQMSGSLCLYANCYFLVKHQT
jgi:hypothetical protein